MVKREQGKPDACREHRYNRDEQSGESLIQKLQNIAFTFEEEEQLTLPDVTGRVGASFYAERVTKKFYDRFKKEHDAFLKFLNGIPDEEMQRWYISVMLNRLMFIYFIQKKDFLDSDEHYLRSKLTQSQAKGTNRYYKEFLCPLFFEGFAKPDKTSGAERCNVYWEKFPTSTAASFKNTRSKHSTVKTLRSLTRHLSSFSGSLSSTSGTSTNVRCGTITRLTPMYSATSLRNTSIRNRWVLTTPKRTSQTTSAKIPSFRSSLTRREKRVKSPLKATFRFGKLLQENPDRYIYDAVKTGVELDLPEEIAAGIDDVSKRTDWNTLADSGYALPTEIWREVVARRQRYETVRAKVANGEIHDINDLITYNLNIRQFAQDVIENCEGPELLRAFWKAITEVTILDPTCGSGAFLFAALNILEPLYEACLDRMQVFLDEVEMISESRPSRRYNDFREILERIVQHPNREYFVLKSIIINNLYGVDIMDEATEICKLRLFLKMVAQLEGVRRIEPLPDIDFNIQAGNTLVGYATYDAVEKPETGRFDFENAMERIREKAEDVKILSQEFRRQQTTLGGAVTPADKQNLQSRLQELEDELNLYLAEEYGVDPNKQSDYENWLNSHKPFHWFIAFYGILEDGGFDVIIGNPPYVEYSKVKKDYAIKGYNTDSCGNLYAFVMERSTALDKKGGRCGMIVPLSGHSTDRMKPLIANFYRKAQLLHIMNISGDANPSVIFPGVKFRLAIFLSSTHPQNKGLHTTKYSKWFAKERECLFPLIEYVSVNQKPQDLIHKLSTRVHRNIIEKLLKHKGSFALHRGRHTIYYHNAPVHWIRAHSFIPYFHSERDGEKISTQLKPMTFEKNDYALAATGIICSSLFYIWWITNSDCYHLNKREIERFPINLLNTDLEQKIAPIAERLMVDLKEKSRRRVYVYETSGRVEYDEFYLKESKSIIDEIDRVLAEHYGFTDEELEFIINYDIKYRMGLGN